MLPVASLMLKSTSTRIADAKVAQLCDVNKLVYQSSSTVIGINESPLRCSL